MSEKKQIITMQILIVFFYRCIGDRNLDPPTFIAQLMGISWGSSFAGISAPFLYGLY